MSSNGFFDEIDKSISQSKADESDYKERIAKRREYLKEVIPRLIPKVKDYEKKLLERNIDVSVESSDRHITFKLKYKNGGHNNLYFGESKSFDGTFCFLHYFTGDKGKSYESTNGSQYTENSWDDQEYINKLEEHIKEFVFYSERYGGF